MGVLQTKGVDGCVRRSLVALLLGLSILVAGCAAGGTPKVAAPELKHDFGDVLTTAEMKTHEFVIKNEGNGDLKLGDPQVKLLEGC